MFRLQALSQTILSLSSGSLVHADACFLASTFWRRRLVLNMHKAEAIDPLQNGTEMIWAHGVLDAWLNI